MVVRWYCKRIFIPLTKRAVDFKTYKGGKICGKNKTEWTFGLHQTIPQLKGSAKGEIILKQKYCGALCLWIHDYGKTWFLIAKLRKL